MSNKENKVNKEKMDKDKALEFMNKVITPVITPALKDILGGNYLMNDKWPQFYAEMLKQENDAYEKAMKIATLDAYEKAMREEDKGEILEEF